MERILYLLASDNRNFAVTGCEKGYEVKITGTQGTAVFDVCGTFWYATGPNPKDTEKVAKGYLEDMLQTAKAAGIAC